jgi:hypothetical protein
MKLKSDIHLESLPQPCAWHDGLVRADLCELGADNGAKLIDDSGNDTSGYGDISHV